MKFTREEEQQIDKAAEFLVQKEYQKTYWNDLIVYEKGPVKFEMIHKNWASKYDIFIVFKAEDKNFFILSELAYARKGLKLLEDEHFEDILHLLQYLQENYDDLIDIEYCRESDKMVDKLLEDAVDKAADFLLKRGYKKKCWNYEMEYENESIKFSMTFRKDYRDPPNIWIKFKEEDEGIFASTLAFIRKGMEMPKNVEKIYTILALLRYIEEDYDNIINIEYCRESEKLNLEYLRRLSEEKIDKAAYFLVEKGYQKVKTEDSIVYKNGNVEFVIYTEFDILKTQSYKSLNDIDIRFMTENESYYVWMIAEVRKQIRRLCSYSEWFKDGTKLLQYIQEDYDNLMDIEYCRESLRMKKKADEMRKYIIESFRAEGYDRFAAIKDLKNRKKWVVHFWELDEWIEFGEKSKKKKEGDIISGELFIDLVCKHKKTRKREKYEQKIEMSPHIEIILKVEEVIDKYSLYATSKYFDEKILVEFESKANYKVGDTVWLEGSLELDL